MQRSKIAGVGYYVPKNVYTNKDLSRFMDTSDEWIQERTGIKERRFADRLEETTTTMGVEAAKIAIERAGITAGDIDFIIFATLSPDYYFPGCGVLLQREMKMRSASGLPTVTAAPQKLARLGRSFAWQRQVRPSLGYFAAKTATFSRGERPCPIRQSWQARTDAHD